MNALVSNGAAGQPVDDELFTNVIDVLSPDEAEQDRLRKLMHESERIENVIVRYCRQEYEESKGAMAENLQRWDRYWAMFFNDFVAEREDSPYKRINVPLLSRNVKLLHAHLSKMTIPDKQKMDFFRAIPKRVSRDKMTPETLALLSEHAKSSEYGVQQNLLDGCFSGVYKLALLDLCVTGQMYGLHCWEQEVSVRDKLAPNPDFDTMNPANNVFIGPDGVLNFKDEYIWDCEEYRAFDAPKTRYVDARNVFPSEMDRNNATECTGVSIYDTTTISELTENAIDNGGLLYANLDKLKRSDEKQNTPEIDDMAGPLDSRRASRSYDGNFGANVPKLKRITRFGRLEKEHLFPEQKVDPEAWAMFCEKFNIDQKKARYCKTWVVETINDRVGVRIQPLPYKRDEIPLTHHRLFVKPNRTLGEGFYKLDEYEERIYNFYRRKGLELTQKVVNPPIAVNEDAFDPVWLQQRGNKFKFIPNELMKMRNTNNVADGFNPMKVDATPLQQINAQMAQSNSNINSLSHLPAVKQGVAGEADSATEASLVSASADLFLDETAEDIEDGFLYPTVRWHYSLEQQYRYEPQMVTRLDANKAVIEMEIPPEVWLNDYAVSIVGRRTVGNKAVQQMAFKEFVTAWQTSGILNMREAMMRHAVLLDQADAEALYQEPQPEGPPPPKTSISGRLDLNELPPEYQDVILRDTYPALSELPGGVGLPMQHMHEFPGDVVGGGSQAGERHDGADNPQRNHHAPGEVERRQRGLKDAEGVNRSAGQSLRNPMNGRRAQGGNL